MRAFILLSLVLIACNSTQETEQTSEQPEEQKKVNDSLVVNRGENCYWQILKGDTLVAVLKEDGDSVTGKLTFDNYQKDGSSGLVKGKVDGGIIRLWYSFQSEGMNSVMEVWYKKQGDSLLRGIGPSGVKNDTSYFTDPSAITFDPNQQLKRMNCSELPEKYQ